MRVLIIEDEIGLKSVIKQILQKNIPDAEVSWAKDGEEALSILDDLGEPKHGPFDLILSDIGLPGRMNGLELWKVCKKKCPKAFFILMSGMPIQFYMDVAEKDAECPPYLSKPF